MKKQNIKMALLATLIASSTVLCSATSVSALTDVYSTKRLGGLDRYETAIEISKEFVSDGKVCDTVLLCSDNAWADSISAGQLGVYKNAPILLTGKYDLNAKTLKRMREMNIKKVLIIGGNGVISDDVELKLRDLGFWVLRHGGSDRYKTNEAIINEIPYENWGMNPMIINGNDIKQGLSVCVNLRAHDFRGDSESKVYVNPVFMVNSASATTEDIDTITKGRLDSSVVFWNSCWRNYTNTKGRIATLKVDSTLLNKNETKFAEIEKSFGWGDGVDIISLENTTQTGAKSNATNLAINKGFKDVINKSNKLNGALLTTGEYYMDSLSVAPLAGKFNMPLVFVDKSIKDIYGYDVSTNESEKENLFGSVYGNISKIYYVGGTAVCPDGREKFLKGESVSSIVVPTPTPTPSPKPVQKPSPSIVAGGLPKSWGYMFEAGATPVAVGATVVTSASGLTQDEIALCNIAIDKNKNSYEYFKKVKSYKTFTESRVYYSTSDAIVDIITMLAKNKNSSAEVKSMLSEFRYVASELGNYSYVIAKKEGFSSYNAWMNKDGTELGCFLEQANCFDLIYDNCTSLLAGKTPER